MKGQAMSIDYVSIVAHMHTFFWSRTYAYFIGLISLDFDFKVLNDVFIVLNVMHN